MTTSSGTTVLATPSQDTVLIVEDEVLARLVIAKYLRECGYRVIEASSADEAVLLLQQPDLRIDIVFSDIEMPGSMDGFGLAQWVRTTRPDLQVLLAGTVPRASEIAGDLCESGPQFAKPYESSAVTDRIRRLMAERRRGPATA